MKRWRFSPFFPDIIQRAWQLADDVVCTWTVFSNVLCYAIQVTKGIDCCFQLNWRPLKQKLELNVSLLFRLSRKLDSITRRWWLTALLFSCINAKKRNNLFLWLRCYCVSDMIKKNNFIARRRDCEDSSVFFVFFILWRIISLYLKHYQQIVCHQSYIVNRIQLKNVVHVSNCRRHLVGRFGIRLVVGTSRKMFRSYPLDESRRRMDWIRWWRIHQSIR